MEERLSHHAEQEGDESILPGLVRGGPKPEEILAQGGIGDEAAHIREGETGATFDEVAALGIGLDAISVDPSEGGRHHTKVQVIDHRRGVAGLTLGTADLLLDLLEAGFDIPLKMPP